MIENIYCFIYETFESFTAYSIQKIWVKWIDYNIKQTIYFKTWKLQWKHSLIFWIYSQNYFYVAYNYISIKLIKGYKIYSHFHKSPLLIITSSILYTKTAFFIFFRKTYFESNIKSYIINFILYIRRSLLFIPNLFYHVILDIDDTLWWLLFYILFLPNLLFNVSSMVEGFCSLYYPTNMFIKKELT